MDDVDNYMMQQHRAAIKQDELKNNIIGQQLAKRALEVAMAGDLSVLLIGPRGAGKQMLCAAFGTVDATWMHRCRCGSAADRCICTPEDLQRWLRLILARIHHFDIVLSVDPVPYKYVEHHKADITYAPLLHKRVAAAKDFRTIDNPRRQTLEHAAQRVEEMAARRLSLPVSTLERVRKVARAIADLDKSLVIQAKHMAEAVQYCGYAYSIAIAS